VILGYFDEILYSHKKEGGNSRSDGYMQALRDVLIDCDLKGLGFTREKFTWKGGKIIEGGRIIEAHEETGLILLCILVKWINTSGTLNLTTVPFFLILIISFGSYYQCEINKIRSKVV
jgi:hypothetical protein